MMQTWIMHVKTAKAQISLRSLACTHAHLISNNNTIGITYDDYIADLCSWTGRLAPYQVGSLSLGKNQLIILAI